jgi:hypothetical protein
MGPTKAARPLVAKNPRAKSKRPGRAGHMAGDCGRYFVRGWVGSTI